MKRVDDYSKTLPILELYTAVQCEGSRLGRPTIVVRTTGCTHRCYFGEGGWCDSWQTSIHPEKGQYSFQDIIDMYDAHPQICEMMLTGGSPTMHPALIEELTQFARRRGIFVTIETEGSHFVETSHPIDLVSISPKFSNTIPVLGVLTPKGEETDEKLIKQHNKFRLNREAIQQMIDYHTDYHLKPVCNPKKQPDIWFGEIEPFIKELGIPKDKVFIMPPGDNREELIRAYSDVLEFCAEHGYNFTPRSHIIAYNKERFV